MIAHIGFIKALEPDVGVVLKHPSLQQSRVIFISPQCKTPRRSLVKSANGFLLKLLLSLILNSVLTQWNQLEMTVLEPSAGSWEQVKRNYSEIKSAVSFKRVCFSSTKAKLSL